MKMLCNYDDWSIYEHNNKHYIANEDGVFEVALVKYLSNEEYEDKAIEDILSMCDTNEYDYSGELDDCSAYCFWKEVYPNYTSAGVITYDFYDDLIAKGIMIYLNDKIVCALDVYEPLEGETEGEARVLVYCNDDDEPTECITINR